MAKGNQNQVRIRHITTAFRLSFPALFEPKEVMQGDTKQKYFTTMVFPKKALAEKLIGENHPAARYIAVDNGAGLYQDILKCLRGNFGPEADPKAFRTPKFRDGDKPREQSQTVDENEAGSFIVRTTSVNRPDLVDQQKNRIVRPEDLYSGCWVRAFLTVSPYFAPQKGVTLYLDGIQKIADDTAFGGTRPRAEDVFDEVVTEDAPVGGAFDGGVAEDDTPF